MKLVGVSIIIGVSAFLLVWLAHLIAAPHGLYTDIEAQKREAIQQSERAFHDLSLSCAIEKNQLSQAVAAWKSTSTDMRTESAVKEGIAQTLQKQNRDQQSTINGCLSQAMKLLSPPSRRISTFYIGALNSPNSVGTFSGTWILLTNVPITPVKITVGCGTRIVRADLSILSPTGSGTEAGSERPLIDGKYEKYIQSPAWTPETPILATIFVAVPKIQGCTFSVE